MRIKPFDPTSALVAPSRRAFLTTAGAGGAWLLVGGCGERSDAAADAAPAAPECGPVADAGRELDATPGCQETEDNLEGPFYLEGAPERAVLVEPDMLGTRLTLSGQVLGTDCVPLASALLDVWQADWREDETGDYDRDGFRLRGKLVTDAAGLYQLETIIPGRYLNGGAFRPAHIHVKASAGGHALLTTQLYFAGDPFNASDPFIEAPLIMCLEDEPDGGKIARFDFVLRRET